MARLCDERTGLFPSSKEILFTCSCPDWASMCKHVAAVLYGIGARLDRQPELLFTLRKVDHQDLIANAEVDLSKTHKPRASAKVLADDDLSEMFGIDLAPATPAPASPVATKPTTAVTSAGLAKQTGLLRSEKSTKPAVKNRGGRQRLTLKKRQAIAERMRKYWAERRAHTRKRKAAKL